MKYNLIAHLLVYLRLVNNVFKGVHALTVFEIWTLVTIFPFFHFVQNACDSDKASIFSLKTRNGIYTIGVNVLIHRNFVSGSGECEVSVVTKCSYRQKCGFQNHLSSPSCKLPACEEKRCYQCKISEPWKFSATIKKLMVKWNIFWNGLYSVLVIVLILKM